MWRFQVWGVGSEGFESEICILNPKPGFGLGKLESLGLTLVPVSWVTAELRFRLQRLRSTLLRGPRIRSLRKRFQ